MASLQRTIRRKMSRKPLTAQQKKKKRVEKTFKERAKGIG